MGKVMTASNLTSEVKVAQIRPNKGRVLVTIKSWPAQSQGGVFLGVASSIIRGEQYITEVEAVGPDVSIVKPGDVVISSMYSGFHISTSDGQVKIINESDILALKPAQDMAEVGAFKPETFIPGINYMLVKVVNETEKVTDSGIVTNVDSINKEIKNDYSTKVCTVISVGDTNEYGKTFTLPKVGDSTIVDSFVGLKMNNMDVLNKDEYKIMYIFDVLGFVGK